MSQRQEPPQRTVLGLDRDRLVDSATQMALVMFLVLAFDEDAAELLQPRVVAVLVSTFVLLTLTTYVLHVATRDVARNDKLPWPGKSRKGRDSRDEN